jgi:hypothetical protein
VSDELDLETLWGMLLSRDAERIRTAWGMLSPAEQVSVRDHLYRMVTESGWLEGQRASAQAALDVLDASTGEPPASR